MSVSYKSFLTNDPLDNYEDPEKFQKWVPIIEKYRKDLEDSLVPEYKIELPKPIEQLVEEQFNPLQYLYDQKLLTPEELEITESSATELVKKISEGLSSVVVFKAFARRLVICHQFTNGAMQIFIDEGIKRAEFLDDYLKKNGKTIGPLHGLPISLKEHMFYKNKITHGSYVSKMDNVPKVHANSIQILEDLGAVFYVRTTQPQTLMHLDSQNNIIGLTRNPFNLSLSSGGSSSGEGAIVSFGASSIGVGSDIGGSIRAPAAYSGCHGLRPTTRRISITGGVSSGAGQESVLAVQGPMARSIDDLELWMKTYINVGKPWESEGQSIPMPWRDVEKPKAKDLTIAVMYDDGVCRTTPPIKRGMKFTLDKLKAAGVKIVEFNPKNVDDAVDIVNKMYACDGNYMQRKLLADSGEPLAKLTKWAMNVGEGSRHYSVKENRELNLFRDALRTEYTKFMVDNKIDYILSPTYSNVAPQSEKVYNWSYTSLWNILDFPTLAFQTGLFQDPAVDKWEEADLNYKYRSDVEQLENENYDPNNFVGAPIGLQLSGRRYFDEEVIAGGKTIVDILGVDLFKK